MAEVKAVVVGAAPRAGRPAELDVESYDTMHVWLRSRASELWARHAKRYLAEFCGFVGRTPDQLIEERSRGLRRDSGLVSG